MVSQKDIADRLNISRTTVTKALLDHPSVSVATKERVKKVALEAGYLPNRVGRSLSTQRTHTIGVVVPKIAHSFFSEAIELMYGAAASLGYQIILAVSFEDAAREVQNVKTLLSMHVDGLIIDSSPGAYDRETYTLLNKLKTPYLFFDRKPTQLEKVHGVLLDDYTIAYQATEYLLARGYNTIGFLAGPQELNVCRDRLDGFTSALSAHEKLLRPEWLLNCRMTEEEGYRCFMEFATNSLQMPEAFVCTNDSMAHGLYRAAAELALRIPQDVGVLAFGDLSSSRLLSPPLTTVKFPLEAMCKAAIKGLVNLIEIAGGTPTERHFGGELIVRESTR